MGERKYRPQFISSIESRLQKESDPVARSKRRKKVDDLMAAGAKPNEVFIAATKGLGTPSTHASGKQGDGPKEGHVKQKLGLKYKKQHRW